jgi:hypothetical protein
MAGMQPKHVGVNSQRLSPLSRFQTGTSRSIAERRHTVAWWIP